MGWSSLISLEALRLTRAWEVHSDRFVAEHCTKAFRVILFLSESEQRLASLHTFSEQMRAQNDGRPLALVHRGSLTERKHRKPQQAPTLNRTAK